MPPSPWEYFTEKIQFFTPIKIQFAPTVRKQCSLLCAANEHREFTNLIFWTRLTRSNEAKNFISPVSSRNFLPFAKFRSLLEIWTGKNLWNWILRNIFSSSAYSLYLTSLVNVSAEMPLLNSNKWVSWWFLWVLCSFRISLDGLCMGKMKIFSF